MSFQVGEIFGDYEVLEILGAGGMGKVYKVRNTISNRIEAAKVLLPDLENSPELADRFLREIRVTATLDHPNIAKLHTALRLNNQLLMIMEFVQGTTLQEVISRGRLPFHQGVGYVMQVLSALSFAHERGIVHRDVKPANMMLTAGGVVKLMDFGIAKMAADRKLTQTGHTMGSLYYMSPEQIRGETDLDGRSDLYSVGISLYEIVTGKKPFEAESQYSIMAAHLHETPRPPLELDPTLPPALNEIIMMAIAKEPEKRFQTADAFRQALAGLLPAGAVSGAAAVTPPRSTEAARAPQPGPPKPVERRPVRLSYMLAGSLATIALLALVLTQAPKWLRTSAEQEASSAEIQQQLPASTVQPPPPGQPTAEQAGPEADVAPPPAATEAPAESPAAAPPAPTPKTITSPLAAPRPAASLRTPSPTPQRPVEPEPAPPPVATPPQAASRTAEPPLSQPPPTPPNTAALEQLRDELMLMAARVGPVRSSLDSHRRSLQAAGLGLRLDIASAEQRLVYAMDQAEAAIARGDAEAAKKYLNMGRLSLAALEKFLGR